MHKKLIVVLGMCSLAVMIFALYMQSHIASKVFADGVRSFGPLSLGSRIPIGPGDWTFAPDRIVPPAKFYVAIAQPDLWCVLEDCSPDGNLIIQMGGWLQADDSASRGLIEEEAYGLDLPEYKNVRSIVIVGDARGKIVGIYPHKRVSDIMVILRLHPDLADFSLLH